MPDSALTSSKIQQNRAFWLKHLHQWHWISSALCLSLMLLFAFSGITLNHASQIEAKPQVQTIKLQLNEAQLHSLEKINRGSLPLELQTWLKQRGIPVQDKEAEWSEEEIYLALPRPGGDAWLRIDRLHGELEFELTHRGVIAVLNDLHKGRHTGLAWSWLIDLSAVACLIFCITGFFLLKMHAGNRPATWPLVTGGIVIPLALFLLMQHL